MIFHLRVRFLGALEIIERRTRGCGWDKVSLSQHL